MQEWDKDTWPPHTAESVKQCIASHEDIIDYRCIALFSALSNDTPISHQDRIPILAGTGSGSTPQEPLALVVGEVNDLVNANESLKDGTHAIRNPDKGCAWTANNNPIQDIYLCSSTMDGFRANTYFQWNITHNGDGGILIESPYAPSSWAAAGLKGSTTSIPWRFIPESYGSRLYYITTDMTGDSPQVATVAQLNQPGGWTQLQRGNKSQLWELTPITP